MKGLGDKIFKGKQNKRTKRQKDIWTIQQKRAK